MKQLIRFFGVLVLASAARALADVLIYQFRTTSKNIGEGVEFSDSTRGYMVWNLEINHLTLIHYSSRAGAKFYGVSDGDPLVVSVAGASGRQFTTFSGVSGSGGRYFQDFNRGLNQTLKHHTGETTLFPRTFKGQSHSLVTSIGPRLTDNAHTFVYSPKRTIAANDTGQAEEVTVAVLRAELEAQGYTDVDAGLASRRSGPVTASDMVLFPSSIPRARTSLVSPVSVGK